VPFLLDAQKAYDALVRFGVETDTLDATGQTVAQHDVGALDGDAIAVALAEFRGCIAQVPPMYSALKRDGRPLYSYARAGQTVERAARPVTVHELDLVAFEPPDRARLRIRCSKGTYVRSLAADLGQRLGTGAHLVELRRTASGPFTLAQAITLDEISARVRDGRGVPMLSVLDSLAHLPRVAVGADQALVLERGQGMTWAALAEGRDLEGPLCAVENGASGPSLVAIVARAGDEVKILRGFRRNHGVAAENVRSR
jgi:tRNA pseudouridine55 synthase